MYHTDYDPESDDRDIYSSSGTENTPRRYEDISSRSAAYRPPQPVAKKAQKKKKRHPVRNTILLLLCAVMLFGGAFYAYLYYTIDKMERAPLDTDNLGVTTDTYGEVRNIALFGIDTREDNDTGRSDAVLVLTVDKKHNKLKLTSIARDTYVAIEGHGNDKLTHAYAYGKSQLAVKTLNQNFGLEITDYVSVNFFGLSRVIDYIGGVEIDVTEKERIEMNQNIFPEMRHLGVDCPNLTSAGVQTLNGGQAVCYARIRHIDSDVQRGNRQKTVLSAMLNKVKKMNPLKLPDVAELILAECQTSLSANDMIALGARATLFSAKLEQLSIPNERIPSSGKMIRGVWYYVYDIGSAKQEMRDFIYEQGYYSAESAAERAENAEQ